jgi:PAS domain S-box-containing protein
MGMWDWDMVTGKINWSPEHEQLFGLAFGSFDGRYETFDQRLHPEDRSILNHAVQQALQTHRIYQCEFRVVWPDHSIHWIEGRGQAFYNESGEPVRMTGTVMAIDDRKQAQITLQQQFEQQRLVMEMTQRIRKSLNLQDILQTTVDEVRQFLECDRVTIFQFSPSWGGTIVVESVAAEWMPILPLQIYDPCIGEENVEPFKQGLVTAKSDIYTADISPCHVEFLASLQVRANLVVPVFQGNELWGLLAAHQCAAPREWQISEIDLLQQLGAQVSIAIQQAALFEQVQTELIERQQAEQTLAKEALRIRTLFNTSFDGIVILDGQGNVIDANPRFAEMLGYTLQETAKLHIFDWDAQFTPEELQQLQRDNLKSGVLETRHRRKDGSIYDVEISFNILEWEGENLGFCVCRDITERKQAQIKLQEREATLRLFAQYAPAGIAMFDQHMRYLMASQRWVDDYYINSIEALIGRSHYEIFPEISQEWRQIHQRCLAGASEKCDEDLFVRLDGTQQWIRWEIHPWHTAIGEVGGIIIFSDDITQYKQAKIALQQLNAELEQRVAQRTEELKQTNDRLLQTVIEQQQTQLILVEQAQLLDLAHDTIMTRDLNGAITFWNEGAEYMYGWTKTLALGQISHTLLQTQSSQPLTEIEAQLLEKGYWEGELLHFRRDAQPINVASRWVLQKDNAGKPIKILEINNDITERKQTEAALKQYVHQVEDLYNNAPCGYHSLDAEGNFIRINDTQLKWLGYTRDEMLHKKFSDILTTESQQVFQEKFPQFKQQGWINNLEFEIVNKDSTTRWISLNATAIKDEAGNFLTSRSTLFDISDRKRSEAALYQYERIVSNTKDGIVLFNQDYIYQIVNQTYLDWYNKADTEILGHSVKEIVGQTFFDSFVQPQLDKCLAGENIQYEKWFDYPNLPPQFMSVTYAPYREQDETISGVIVSLRDITKLQKAEAALRQSEEKFRQLAENIQAVFWMTDIHTQQVLYVSPAYETIWQRTCQSLYQNFSAWLDAVHPDDRPLVKLAFSQQLKTGQSDTKYRIIRPDGSMRWIRDRAFPIKNELGEMVRIAGLAEDITELQKVEQMKSEFIGIVSHELRTPLTSIRAAMGLLNTGIYDKKPDKFKRMIEIAALESERLVRLVNDILDLERLESGRAVLEKTICNAADLIEQAVEGVQAIAKQQNISFNIHATDAQVWAAADAIIQTLTNLLGNAIKFSPADATISLSVQQQTNHVLFQVSDQGRGIPAEKLELIFGRFQQVDATDSRVKGGTGLGLAICRSIIDLHGGQIWAESIVGVGSTFFFTLPKNRG